MSILIIILLFLLSAGIIFLLLKFFTQMNSQIALLTQQLNERLKEGTDTLSKTQSDITQRLEGFSSVQKTLARMEENYRQVLEISKDIAKLQDLFRAPKFRGGIGEFSLESLLSQILPSRDFFTLQYPFKNGLRADAVIKIGDNLVVIDAKFPLESFSRMVESSTEEEKRNNRRQFVRSVQERIDEISSKYILPDEGTYDFALMYIPAENVYYETILKDMQEKEEKSIYSYALNKKVIPISPHTLYPYLMVILRGLKGMVIEKNAQEVIANLGRLQVDLNKFKEDFRLAGNHLSNAKSKHEDAEKRLEKFCDKLIAVSGHSLEKIEKDV